MGLLEHSLPDNVLFTKLDQLTMRWGLRNSLWYMLFATACCAIELMQTGMSRYDFDRFGMLPRATPRQSDLMIIAGTVTYKMALRIKRLYEQMPEPKYVIAMGSCANCGGGFVKSYNVLNGVDKIIPVDVYVPGCPPKPEALIEGCLKLMDKINGQPRLVRKAQDRGQRTEGGR